MSGYGLNLGQNHARPPKKSKKYIILFLCFAVLLGAFSFLLLWKSLDYDFNNIYRTGNSTTEVVTTTQPVAEKQFEGFCVFAVGVTDDEKKELHFAQLISVDLSEKTVRIVPVSSNEKVGKTKISTEALKGGEAFKKILSEKYTVNVDRYVLLTETQYKSVFRTMGNIIINIPSAVEYDTDDMFLEMNKGENELTPEKVSKYMKYLCETLDSEKSAQMNAQITLASFNSFFTAEKFIDADSLFEKVINNCHTDITIVDFTNSKEKIEYLIPVSAKNSLKVFVSNTVKEISDEE